MVSNLSQLFVSPGEISPRTDLMSHGQWVGGRVLDRARAIFCGLQGHEHLLRFHGDRMYLRCLECGHESSGWQLNATPPTITAR